MCGIAGYMDLAGQRGIDEVVVDRMLQTIAHRGPDSSGTFAEAPCGIGFRRLALVDLATGDQPLYNEDRTLVLACNGEIYNHRELRRTLTDLGHRFATHSDVEVILHGYEEYGPDVVHRLNGQFAFALFDRTHRRLMLARDHSGIAPMYFTQVDGTLVFGSEIKAILRHPKVPRRVDPIGLDQIMCFPGLVSPRTMFAGIESLPPGSMLTASDQQVKVSRYWKLHYPVESERPERLAAADYERQLLSHFRTSVHRRMQADVPVGIYLSGGLDSSMIACMARQLAPDEPLSTFSITFDLASINEEKHQKLVAAHIGSKHHEIRFGWNDIVQGLRRMVHQAESPVKETYNVCSMALSALARSQGIKAILTGEGADELYGGYPGYKFDALAQISNRSAAPSHDEALVRHAIWGQRDVVYEKNYATFAAVRSELYSQALRERLRDDHALSSPLVDPSGLPGRHRLHQRSYLDFHVRLSDHLLTEHGDRMLLANSVEGRYPFLDQDLVAFTQTVPPDLKLCDFNEKYLLKRIASSFVPKPIVQREKYGFHAPGSPWLLRHGGDFIADLVSPERIRRDGFFDPAVVSALVERYSRPDYSLDARVDDDLLMVVISFNLFVDTFDMPPLNA